MRSRIVSILAAAWVAGTALSAGAEVFYASPKGSDTNPGSAAQPWRSLHKASGVMKAGDTLLIADGEYLGGVKQRASGDALNPITYKAVNPGKAVVRADINGSYDAFVVMEASWIVVDGLVLRDAVRGGIWVASSNNVTVRNCFAIHNGEWGLFSSFSDDVTFENNECAYNAHQHGIYVSNSGDRPIVRGNICHDNGKAGIQLNGDAKLRLPGLGTRGDGIIDHAVVENNILYNNNALATAAMNLACVHNGKFVNNLIFHNKRMGIALSNDNSPLKPEFGCKNNLFAANTIYFKPGEGGWCFSMTNGSTDNLIVDNIIVGGHRSAYEFDSSCSFRADYNVIFSTGTPFVAITNLKWLSANEYQYRTGNDRHSVFADVKFVNPLSADPDFRLQTESPAKNTAIALPEVPADLLGRPIPVGSSPDPGCYGAGDGDLTSPIGTQPPPNLLKTGISAASVTIARGRNANLKASLKAGRTPLPNRPLVFKVDGAFAGQAVTNASGLAVISHPANGALGTHSITVEFAGDDEYAASTGTGVLTIRANTKILGDRFIAPAGITVLFGAKLNRTDTAEPLTGKTLGFYDDAGLIGTAVTDLNGRAEISVKVPGGGVKKTFTIKFEGEEHFRGFSGTGSITGR